MISQCLSKLVRLLVSELHLFIDYTRGLCVIYGSYSLIHNHCINTMSIRFELNVDFIGYSVCTKPKESIKEKNNKLFYQL